MDRRLGGPQSWSGRYREEKNLAPAGKRTKIVKHHPNEWPRFKLDRLSRNIGRTLRNIISLRRWMTYWSGNFPCNISLIIYIRCAGFMCKQLNVHKKLIHQQVGSFTTQLYMTLISCAGCWGNTQHVLLPKHPLSHPRLQTLVTMTRSSSRCSSLAAHWGL
jgi:hypothetical protein